MPVLSVRPEERRLIPYEVQALYELGRISKEQLDNYVKTRSEEYLRSYEENLRTDPARQVGNLAAPVEKEAPWPDSSPVQYSALDTLKDTVVGLQTSTVGGLVNLGNLAAQGISTQGEWAGRFMEATGLPQVGKPLREFSDTYGDVASRETGAYREALQGVASERKSEGLKQSELALGNLLGSKGFKDLPITEQASQIAKFIGGNKKLAAYMATESLGGLATGGPLAKAANILRGSSIASNVAARLAGGGILAGQELAGIQSDVYNTVYQETGSADQASKAASTAATDPLVLLAAGIDVFTGAEATSLITGAQKAARRATRPTLTSVMAAAGKAGATEAGGEFLQEGAQSRAENLAMGRPAWEGVAGRATLGALVGGPMGATVGGISNISETRQQAKDAEARIAQGKAVYENIAKSGADVNTLSEARTAIARSLGLEADTIEDAQTLANRFKQNDVPSKVRAKAVAETILTGDPAFDAGQKAAQQTFQLAEQYKAGAVTFGTDEQQTTKPVEATVTQFEPLARRPATPVQGNLGSFTVEAPVAKETLTERGLKKANLRLDKDTRMLDTEIANLRSQLGTKVDPITGVDPVRAQLAEAETLREGIARERLRTAEKAKPAEPTPYAKEMRRFQEQPKVEVNAKIPEAPKISRAESITNKVAEEVTAKTKKELPENTKQRVTDVAALVENELTFSGALRGLDEKAANDAVLAKTREYLASGEKEADIEKRVTDIRKKRDADFEAFAKETATTLKNHDEVLKTLDRNLGKDVVDGLVRSDKVRVLSDFQRAEFARTQEERDRGQGVYIDKDGIIYLNAANLNKKDENGDLKREIAMAVLAHEQGHTKNFRTEDGKRVPVLKGLAGDAAYDALNKAIADSAKGTGRIADIAKRAQERAQSGVEAAQKAGRQVELKDELPQYFVEELVNSYDGPLGPFRKFIDETSAKARDIINRSPLKMDIRPQDLGWMVKQDLIAESKTPKTTGTKQAKFSYIGESAKNIDQAPLQKAKKMQAEGKSAEDIRNETGWFLNPWDGAWRFEVSDKDVKFKTSFESIPESEILGKEEAVRLEDVLDHPSLFESYPDLKDVKLVKRSGLFDFLQNLQGWYNDDKNTIGITPYAKDPLGTLLHEIQHWIQGMEGFGIGGNESSAFEVLPEEAKATLASEALNETQASLDRNLSEKDAYSEALKNDELIEIAKEALALRDNKDIGFLDKYNAINLIEERVKNILGNNNVATDVATWMNYGFHKDIDGFKEDMQRRFERAVDSAARNTKTIAGIKSGDKDALLQALSRNGRAFKFYQSLSGEIEARDVTNRKDLDVDERKLNTPYEKTLVQDAIKSEDVLTVKNAPKGRVNLSLGTKEATGFKEAKKQGKTFTSPVTGEEIFEIPDTDMKVNAGILRSANGKPIDLEVALVHDELFKQWPFLRKDVKIKTTDKFALNEAEYDPRTKTITISNQNIDNIYNYALSAEAKKEARKDISKTVLHEITHAIQDKIGAEMGSNPTFEMYEYVADKLRNMNNNKLAAEYSRVLNAVKRNQKNVDKLFQGISKLRDQWEAKGKKWPETYTDLDIHFANDPALAGQIMPFVKGLGLNNLRELHETYNFLRQAKNAGYWAYMANRGEVTARAVAHVFDGKFATLKEAEEAVAKQFGELSTQGNSKAAFQTFEKQAPQMKAKPAVLMSLGATIEVDGKTRPTTNSKGQPIADSVESARNFWQWFGDSKVVDAQGRPLVVYHGTNADFSVFDAANGGSASGAKSATMGFFAASNPAVASSYANDYNYYAETKIGRAMQAVTGGWYEKFNEAILGALGTSAIISGGNVMPLYLSIKNPKVVDFGGREYRERTYADVIDQAKRDGHDGVILRNTFDEGYVRGGSDMTDVYVTFDSTQIKSVNNRGSWDKNDPRILMSLGEAVEVDGVQRPTTNSKGQPIADSVESARNFWQWFGDSKVVDADGKPLVVYHGTSADFTAFDASRAGSSTQHRTAKAGFFFSSDSTVAELFAGEKWSGWPLKRGFANGANVMPVYLSIGNPLRMPAREFLRRFVRGDESIEQFAAKARADEHDGLLIVADNALAEALGADEYGADAWVAFRPEQIKSINNNGTWSKEDTRILFSLAPTIEVDGKVRPTTNSKGQPLADSVESARNFWRWFGDSKVVDADGKPLVVYHGTRFDFESFDAEDKPVWFSATPDLANDRYAFGESDDAGANVMPSYLSIKNPKVLTEDMDDPGPDGRPLHETVNTWEYRRDLMRQGFDGIVVNEDGQRTYAAFRPEQIKSVNNNGTWSKEDPRILFSLAPTIEVDGKVRPTTNSKGQPLADSVESARNFWRWFGDSKVVDADGKPLVVYHGTSFDFNRFDSKARGGGGLHPGLGFFFAGDDTGARSYATRTTKNSGGKVRIISAYLSLQNPKRLELDELYEIGRRGRSAEFRAELESDGYDGIIAESEFSASNSEYVAFIPEQIKSVNNNGTWSKEDTRILFSLAGDVKEKAQIASEAAKEKTSVAWKYLQGALWDMRPAKFKIAEEMRDGYVRYIEQKGREMAQRMVEAANKDGITLDALKEAWGQAREYGVLGDTGSAKVNALMQAMRDEIDSLSMQIEEVYDESGTPLSDEMKETFNKNLFKYISRSFEIDFNKGWSKNLLRAAKKDPNSKEATIINDLRNWLNDEIVARLESLELLDDKQIKSLYKRLIDEDAEGKSVETMTKALESFKGNLKSEELVDILQNDVLRLSKVSGVGNYYRGAARNEGILQKKTNIPSPILAAMGERVGPAESFLTTIVRQGSLFAQTKMLADFRKAMPESFTTDQTPENTVRIEDKQGKYGPLAGLYTTPAMKEYIEEKITQEEKMDALMTNLHSAYAQEELATRLVKGGLKNLARVSGVYKVWSIMTNTANYLYNMVNGAASLARYNTLGTVYGMDYVDKEGNKIPLHKWFPELAADFLWRGSVTGTSSHELYGLAVTANFVGSAMSGDIKEAFLDTIRETVEGKKPGMIKSGWRRATWLADAWFSGPEALPNILGVVVESNYLRKLWEAQALDFTHDELMAAAADRVKRNAISRDRAIPGAKFLDKYAAQAFLTFFTETVRAPMQTAYDAVMDIKESNRPDLSPKAKKMMRGHAAAHLAGAATTAAAIYGITQAIALAFGRPFGTEDDEDPEGLEEDLRDRPEDLIVIGTDKDGRKLVFDLSKLNTYSLITNVVREAAQGNLEGAGRQAKSFLFANPLPQKVWTEFTDNYGEAGKSDVAIAVNNAIADTPLGQVVDPTTVNELVKVMSMFTPGFIKDPKKALENAQGLQENLALGFVGAGARPVAYQPVKTLRYQMGTALDELETARSKLNAAMRTKDASEKLIKQEMRRYYNAERDLILKNRPLVQAALKNNTSEKELRQLFKFLGANKHLNEQMLSNKPYKPTAMHKNWLTMSQKLATFGEPEKVKEEQGMIYTQNKAAYHKLFKEIYGDKE